MKKFFVILSLSFYTLGQIFLPQGNFAYIEQIPRLYKDFCHTNQTANVIDFINEQFLEFAIGNDEQDEPQEENEAKSVPFYTPCEQVPLALVISASSDFIALSEKETHHNFTYLLKEHWVHASSIYHPPKNSLA
ncbi:MAG TPA: hypothetical protein VK835_11015 [Bacteroidia bacterium]|jgi:hypothetical protein|nr:hypothetical protein [Bacteroidia bacterium]